MCHVMFEVGVKDILDIFLVAVILFSCYKLMKQSRSVNIFYGLLLFISFWIIISKVVEMKLLGSILDQVVSVGAIAVIVLFQEEIRHFFFRLGTHERANRFINFWAMPARSSVIRAPRCRPSCWPASIWPRTGWGRSS